MVKRILKILLLGVCFGAILLMVQLLLEIDRDVFLHGYWMIAPAIVIAAVLVNVCYNMVYYHRVQKAAALLAEGRIEDYIQRMETMLKTAKGKSLKELLTLNLAAGYLEAKEYARALPILEELSDKPLRGEGIRIVQRIDLCLGYFETGQYGKFLAGYNGNQSLFGKYRKSKAYGGNIVMLDMMAAIIKEQYAQAEALLAEARGLYADVRLQKGFAEIEGVLSEARNNSRTPHSEKE